MISFIQYNFMVNSIIGLWQIQNTPITYSPFLSPFFFAIKVNNATWVDVHIDCHVKCEICTDQATSQFLKQWCFDYKSLCTSLSLNELRGIMWCNNSLRAPDSSYNGRILIFTSSDMSCKALIMMMTNFPGFVVTIHYGTWEQYIQSLRLKPNGLGIRISILYVPLCFVKTGPSTSSLNPWNKSLPEPKFTLSHIASPGAPFTKMV